MEIDNTSLGLFSGAITMLLWLCRFRFRYIISGVALVHLGLPAKILKRGS